MDNEVDLTAIRADLELSSSAWRLLVAALLDGRAAEEWNNAELMKLTGLSRQSVTRVTVALKKMGYLEVESTGKAREPGRYTAWHFSPVRKP